MSNSPPAPVHGWIILDKPYGMGSTQGVSAIKRVLRSAGLMGPRKGPGKTRIGHGGTLDPLATGVLPIAIGEATKLCGQMLDARKSYDFTIAFGRETDTLDVEGAEVASSETRPTLAEIEAILPHFTGPIEQMPPAYSALKVDGQRAYDLARAGKEVTLKARQVEIFALEIVDAGDAHETHRPLSSITLSATVSKGTYIRSLARDIARALETCGHVTMLRRTAAGPFALDQAISLDNLEKAAKGPSLDTLILPVEAGLADIPALDLTPEQAGLLNHGQVINGIAAQNGRYWARDAGKRLLALVTVEAGSIRIQRGFNL